MIEKGNLVLAGVGGQGVVSLAQLISILAADNNLYVKQSEVHGMAQRGGSVSSHVRFSKQPVSSAIIAQQEADFILGAEPLETLRNLEFLKLGGIAVSSVNTLENPDQIPNYPGLNEILTEISMYPHILVDSLGLARKAGNPKTESMVLMGTLSPFLGIAPPEIEKYIHLAFDRKGEQVVNANLKALQFGLRENAFFQIEQILNRVCQDNRFTLLEPEAYQILQHLETSLPEFDFLLADKLQLPQLSGSVEQTLKHFGSEKIVLKIVSPDISHKQDAGGVLFAQKNAQEVCSAVDKLLQNAREKQPEAVVKGILLAEFVEHSSEFGHELLLGLKQDQAVGPIITFGAGGTQTEFYAQQFGEKANAVRSTFNLDRDLISKMINSTSLGDILFGRSRTKEALVPEETLISTIASFAALAEHFSETNPSSRFVITQAEVNPFAVSDQKLIALDARLQFAVKKNS